MRLACHVVGSNLMQASLDDYHSVMVTAGDAWRMWREVPAPRRGDIVRQVGNALREKVDLLGRLVREVCCSVQAVVVCYYALCFVIDLS